MLRCYAVILGLYDMYCSYTVTMEIYNPVTMEIYNTVSMEIYNTVSMEIYNPVWLGVCAAAPNRPKLCWCSNVNLGLKALDVKKKS